MPVQVFVDESGGKGHSRHLVLAGLIADAEAWAAFSDEWCECLSRSPAVKYFKMSEAAIFTGQFYRWTKHDRDAKLRAFARIINRCARIATYSAIDLEAHAETWAKSTSKPRNDPYFWPFHNTIMAACFSLWDCGWRERFEIIFDQNVIFGPRAKLFYPVIREIVKIREPDAFAILPIDPRFDDDKDFVSLQAADLFAGCIRNATNNPEDKQFEWLLDELKNVVVSDYSQYCDKARMEAVTSDSLKYLREGLVPQEVVEKFREIFDTIS